MSDERLLAALTRLGAEELPAASDRAIRGRIETVWTARANRGAAPRFGFRRFAPAFAGLALVAGVGAASLRAGADSPLWDARVAIEDAAAILRTSTDARVAYLLDLVSARTEEAARQEALGHGDAAARARVAAAAAIVDLDGNIPQLQTPAVPSSPSPTPAPTATPSASALPVPSRTAPVATPARTDLPRPALTPIPTAPPTTAPRVTITGTVKDVTGAAVAGVCISTSAVFPTSTTQCSVKTTAGGSYVISGPIEAGQPITLHAYWIGSTGTKFSASTTATTTAPTTFMSPMTLTPQR